MALSRAFPRAASFAAILSLFTVFDACWTRQRVWGPKQVLLTIFALVEPGRASSYQLACKTTCAWADRLFGWLTVPDPGGFSAARARLEEADCLRLLDAARCLAQNRLRRVRQLVCGLMPVGIDGSILHMRRSPELVAAYGVPTDKHGVELCHYPQALLISAWDLARRIPLAWALGSHTGSERAMLLDLLVQLPLNALLVLDRGYPSDVVLGSILDSQRHFLVRMVASKGAAWNEVSNFLASGRRDAIVPVDVGEGASRRSVQLRMILRVFNRGRPGKHQGRETMVIITSLLDPTVTARDICRLYGERWGVETIYREMKAVAVIEHWHGESVAFVRQELILLLVWFCFAALFAAIARATRPSIASDTVGWRANTRRVFEAIALVMDAAIAELSRLPGVVDETRRRGDAAVRAMCTWIRKLRPGRSYQRVPMHPYARVIS